MGGGEEGILFRMSGGTLREVKRGREGMRAVLKKELVENQGEKMRITSEII